MTLKELEEQVRALAAGDRAKLAEVLLDSLRDAPIADIEKAWASEIDARVAAYERGELDMVDAESVFAEARRLAE
jgi:putative addiction module component (TIGR02574 family)